MISELQQKIHLVNRLTFGPKLSNLDELMQLSPSELIHRIVSASEEYKPLDFSEMDRFTFKDFDGVVGFEARTEVKKSMRIARYEINLNWINVMINTKSQLREKMALFWHDHFPSKVYNPLKSLRQINFIREHALGSFRTLLHGISKDPAMIEYLNTNLNVKTKPNENFARELLELFSMGEGNYTEADIKEAARAFAGWGFTRKGKFRVRPKMADRGVKTFMGRKGRLTGENVINIILDDRRTAVYILSKIYYYLVGSVIEPHHVEALLPAFYPEYNILKLIIAIVTHDEFSQSKYLGSRVKSPIEHLIGTARVLNVTFHYPGVPFKYQLKTGQTLLSPPSVAGWPNGVEWINSGVLGDRMLLASNIYNNSLRKTLKLAEMNREGDNLLDEALDKVESFKVDFNQLIRWMNDQGHMGFMALVEILLGGNLVNQEERFLTMNKHILNGRKDVEQGILSILSTPEYQMH